MPSRPTRYLVVAAFLGFVAPAVADDVIEGVQAASLDQPRVQLSIRRTAKGPELVPKGGDAETVLEAFLDTGASGIVLSSDTIAALGITAAKAKNGKPVAFHDVGVGGTEEFGVTEPLHFTVNGYPNETSTLASPVGLRAQIRPEGGVLAMIAPSMDVAGTPLIAGNVIVIDPSPLKNFDKLQTMLLPPRDKRIPKTSRTVPLTGVSFASFTRVEPEGADAPAVFPNPMIGPHPFRKDDTRKPIAIRHNGKTATGTFLLDTGAAASMVSTRIAKELGIALTEDGAPVNVDNTYSLPIGGIGGMRVAHGLFFDRLELPTTAGAPIAYAKAPLLIADITVVGTDNVPFTLDGVLGMNFLVASAEIAGGALPQVGEIVDGPFKVIVIDLDRGTLGVEPR